MKLDVRVFSVPKQGNTAEEYEDASHYNLERGRVALADGAGDAFASSLWARALVQRFVAEPPAYEPDALLAWLDGPTADWQSQIVWDKLPWYIEDKARRGTFATLLGVTLEQSESVQGEQEQPGMHWQAVAIGDACLFHVRRGELIGSFPLQRSDEFNNAPPLLSNHKAYSQKSLAELHTRSGDLRADELLVLATDALANWYLSRIEALHDPISFMARCVRGEFLQLVDEARADGSMKNDDVTLVLLWLK